MRRILLLLAAAMAVVVGCSAPVVGTPAAGDAGVAPGAVIDLPPRPRELRLDNIDPCSLLTSQQRTELGLDGGQVAGTSDAPYFAGPKCAITGFEPRDVGTSLTLATGSSLEQLLAPGVLRDSITPTTVNNFPAVIAKPTFTDFCSVDVDVAEGQFLDVQFRDSGKNPPIPQDQLCQEAVRVAESALLTLQIQ